MILYEFNKDPSSYRPTNNERMVLAKIAIASTPQLAFDQIARGVKLNAAAESLARLGFVSILDGEASLTDDGMKLAIAQAIIDQAEQPTDQGLEIGSQEST